MKNLTDFANLDLLRVIFETFSNIISFPINQPSYFFLNSISDKWSATIKSIEQDIEDGEEVLGKLDLEVRRCTKMSHVLCLF
jgi:hypothetical protein